MASDIIKIERASEEDAREIFDLVNSAYVVELEFKSANRYRKLQEVIEDIPCTVVARDREGSIVGSARITEEEDDVVVVGPLAVQPNKQAQGIGTMLMRHAETLAPRVRVGVVNLREPLFPFYRRLGFEKVDEFPAYKTFETLTRDDVSVVVMEKKTTKTEGERKKLK